MKSLLVSLGVAITILMSGGMAFAADPPKSAFPAEKPLKAQTVTFKTAADCGKNKRFFGIPPWYKHLKFDPKNCDIAFKIDTNNDGKIDASDNSFNFVWLIALAIVEALLVIAGLIAVAFVIVGGVKFITAQGVPDKIANARKTILNALIGAVIAILGSRIVAFIAGTLT